MSKTEYELKEVATGWRRILHRAGSITCYDKVPMGAAGLAPARLADRCLTRRPICLDWSLLASCLLQEMGHRRGRQTGNRNNKIIAKTATVKNNIFKSRRFGNSATKAFYNIVYFSQYYTEVMA